MTAPIQIRVYDDRLCIWNPGVLPEDWTVKKLFAHHASCPYNPLVANAFFRAGEIEAWGRGMKRIVDACREAGAPRPKVQYSPGDLWFEFPFSPAYLEIIPAAAKTSKKREAQVEAQVDLTQSQQSLLNACIKGEKTGQELLAAAGYESRTGNFKKGLQRFLEYGLIEMTIPDKQPTEISRDRKGPRCTFESRDAQFMTRNHIVTQPVGLIDMPGKRFGEIGVKSSVKLL